MTSWNFGDIFEAIAETIPELPALQAHGDERTWAEFNENASKISSWLIGLGVDRQDGFAQYLYNCPEFMESVFAAFKASLCPVNTNYRYVEDELIYLWDNADVSAVMFHGCFVPKIEAIKSKLPKIKGWLFVDDGTEPCPDWAANYTDLIKTSAVTFVPKFPRTPDDLYLLYTGGTTGMPKGVMWRQDDLFALLNNSSFVKWPPEATADRAAEVIKGRGMIHLSGSPLMHGTGAFTAFAALLGGGTVVTLNKRSFDPVEMLDAIDEFGVQTVAIVGDAFAKPILRTLDENPEKWTLTSLFAVLSSGVMWSSHVKEGLLRHKSTLLLADIFSSSEAIGMGASVTTSNSISDTAKFVLGPEAKVIDDNNVEIPKGSKTAGRLALKGRTPIGYYKDEEKTNRTFPVIDGVRYSVPGDYATVDENGTIHLLGRGSQCINTGGEKVFPEEVEELIKEHDSVADAVVLGLDDEKFGETVNALVQLLPGEVISPEEIRLYLKTKLAAYKIPKQLVFVDSIGRSPAGKVDYAACKKRMTDILRG
jgi:acyl-CoA synthetase (AMP-forming)/AMP-acid ligase II